MISVMQDLALDANGRWIRMPIFGHSKFLPVFLYQKGLNEFGIHIFGHSELIPVFWRKIFGKNLEWPFLAIPNLFQSSWEKLLGKIPNSHFWPFQIHTSIFGKKIVGKKSELPFLAIPNSYQSFWEKLSEKNSESPILAILNLYQFFWEKLLEKIWNGHFWPFQIYTSLLGKNCWKKFQTVIFCHSKFIAVFLGKIARKNLERPFLASLYTSLFEKNCQKKFGMAIFGHSKFIAVFLGKIIRKNLKRPFLAILNFF